MKISAHIGFDRRFPMAYAVAVKSLVATSSFPMPIHPILLPDLIAKGDYTRPTHKKDGQMWDDISCAPMSTEFSISRFFVPMLEGFKGWSLFCDSDFLFRADVAELFVQADQKYAVMCVKHEYCPPETTKMDGQIQTVYKRKNWSSFMLFNNEHPANRILDKELLNAIPGRDLHGFMWLNDCEIGGIDPEWNWLEGHSSPEIDAKAVHYTRGTPDVPGYESAPYADEWNAYADRIPLCKEW